MKAKVILLNDHQGHNSTQVGILIKDSTYISIEGEGDWTIIMNFGRTKDIRKVVKEIDVPHDFEDKIFERARLKIKLNKAEDLIENIYNTGTKGNRHLAR